MVDKMSIKINVDTFNDGDAYFVRTEIDAHTVSMQGPFTDLQVRKGSRPSNWQPGKKRPIRSRSKCSMPFLL